MPIPYRLLRAFVLRGLVIWGASRVIAVAVLAYARVGATPALPLWSVAITAALFRVDQLRRKESLLLANLGVAGSTVVLIGTLPALLAEVALGLLQ